MTHQDYTTGSPQPAGHNKPDHHAGVRPGDEHRGAPIPPDTGGAMGTPDLGPDASAREIASAARAAFVGADLIQSGPIPWPFGRRARARREWNRQAAQNARRRRAQFQQAFETPSGGPRPLNGPRRVDRRTNRTVIASLAGLAVSVVAAAVWLGGHEPHPSTLPAPLPATTAPRAVEPSAAPSLASTTPTVAVPEQPPIPTGGVAPITPRPQPTIDPTSVVVVDPPTADPTPAELATPGSAVRAWLARLCPFDYRQPFGAAEQRARPAMTDAGWNILDPSRNTGPRASWDRTVTARESGHCAAPTVLISPEAPRSPTTAIVVGSVDRVVSPDGGQPYVEHLSEVRIVRQSADGLWWVDLPTEGG